jgi:hypothetical protein
MMDPKILSLALLSRTLLNFKGVILLTRQRMVVAARVMTRCCYENMFMVGGLFAEGEAFADRMIEDDKAGRKGRINFALETESIFKSLSVDMQQAVKDFQSPKVSFLRPKDASGLSEFKDTYLVYSEISSDAAHPTIAALARHWGPADDKTAYFDAIPGAKEDELDVTLHFACIALIDIMVVVNKMNGGTEAGKKLPTPNGELKTLQSERWSPETCEGMDIL